MKLENKVAVVTGASSGMGREISLLFAKEGAKVVVVARRKERLEELVSLAEEYPGTIIAFQGDVSKKEDAENMIKTAVEKFGRIDILVNNAGVLDDFTPAAEVTDELWEYVMSINLNGPFYACRKAIPIMINQGEGNIINVASIGGLYGARAGAAYTASKHALVGLTKNIGFMYADKNIRCNVICPGGVDTEITQNKSFNEMGMKRVLTGVAASPRSGSSEEIANVALFLASKDSSLLNGASITADAGFTAY
ncbi:glucose 1-dehydrogenase [Clostridium polynesiense]|uniref:glucose 1-dehydrogenase n=1 Tax=Clostridium polynesiense TaxID=1325933 RepID=UPI000A6BD155|nr:glucose 1-dehydrogenase [Clostridium polynesiense]